MTDHHPTRPPGDKMKRAIMMLCELRQQYPEKRKQEILQIVEMQLDLSPRECDFLTSQFGKEISD